MVTDRLIGVREVAQMLGLHPEHVRLMTRRGDLPGKKFGQRNSPYKYSQKKIEALIGRF